MPIVPDPRDARIADLEAENARLEALIVGWADCAPDVGRSLLDEADRIRCRRSGVECPTRGKKE
jgi:hypothetical protein